MLLLNIYSRMIGISWNLIHRICSVREVLGVLWKLILAQKKAVVFRPFLFWIIVCNFIGFRQKKLFRSDWITPLYDLLIQIVCPRTVQLNRPNFNLCGSSNSQTRLIRRSIPKLHHLHWYEQNLINFYSYPCKITIKV